MAMPVVSAAILAALLVPAYARMKEQDKSFDLSTMSSRDAAGAGTTKAGSPAGKGKAGKGAGKSAKGGAAAAKASSGAGASAKSSSSAASGARLLERGVCAAHALDAETRLMHAMILSRGSKACSTSIARAHKEWLDACGSVARLTGLKKCVFE